MNQPQPDVIVNLMAVIVAVTDEVPRVLVVDDDGVAALPNGPFEPAHHASLEYGLRQLVVAQTGLDLYYVEQLYTFGNRYRVVSEIKDGRRVVSIAYLALTREDPVQHPGASWAEWYRFLPWEDWRFGRPDILDEVVKPALDAWVRDVRGTQQRKQRSERLQMAFGDQHAAEMDSVLSLERFELLYEAGVVQESRRDTALIENTKPTSTDHDDILGEPMVSDHRRVLATALGRLRGKLAYRPVVFELLPGEFTLLQLQRVAEALSGARLHKQNFRRLVINADLVEPIGRTTAVGRGRPAKLFRFRREVLGERFTVGLSRPIMRED